MRAAVLDAFGEALTETDVELAEPAPDEVLVRVTDSGICHSDRTVHLGTQDRPLPLILGHEASGVVERVGSQVSGLAPGDHVVGCASANCGRCPWCARGLPQHCADKGQVRANGSARLFRDGSEVHAFVGLGGFADHMLVSERALVRLPPQMPLDKAALLGCAVLTGMGAVLHRAQVRAGQTVAVIGCGGVGLNAVQAARLAGAAQIIAVDINGAKLERARVFGATDIVDASRQDSVDAVHHLSGGGVDHALEVVGSGPTIEQAFAMTAVRGTATVVGVPHPAASVTLPAHVFMAAEKKIQGSRMGSGNFRADIPSYCDLYLRGQLLLDELISEVIELSDVTKGLVALDGSDGARSVIHFD
ncbi:MAG TPA: Zn-dependent alcohol dehydrogenase [Streptosporangiaceae bacterium]|nr:Zn-dependent alcohol dehydrogenase [Streptosporangiaceae bacterium]